jgi:hypothetical protein
MVLVVLFVRLADARVEMETMLVREMLGEKTHTFKPELPVIVRGLPKRSQIASLCFAV